MWLFLDTFHELQHPTYASIYPPAQGLILALGQMLGQPWIGVLLSVAAMTAAIAWALQGWVPSRWALLGTVLLILQIDLMTYWTNSYWGGAVAAAGGALLLGALPRLMKTPKISTSLLMGFGAAVLANSRPVEGFLFCVPVVIMLATRVLSSKGRMLRDYAARAILPAGCVLVVAALFMGYYNWRVTGHPLLFPHVLYHRLYWDFPVFVWDSSKPPLTYDNPQFTGFFVTWARSAFLHQPWSDQTWVKLFITWNFFMGPALSIPLITLPRLVRDRSVRFVNLLVLWCVAWLLLVVWYEPHYAAPMTAGIFILIVQGMRYLRLWKVGSYRVGVRLSRLAVLFALVSVFWPGGPTRLLIRSWNRQRAEIAHKLERLPEKQLVIVHYAANHNVHCEWVYNAADIDSAKIVWAREIPGRDLQPLLDYFRDRKVWIVDADDSPPRLLPYEKNTTE